MSKKSAAVCLTFVVTLLLGCTTGANPTPTQRPADIPTVTATEAPASTLVPPTLVPFPTATDTPRPASTTLERIQSSEVVRVGVLYNEPPFSRLNERGQVEGYDADIARAMAESWGIEIEFVQVTRLNRLDKLLSGEVDLLMGAMPHRREYEALIDFSQSYFDDGQVVMTMAEGGPATPDDLNGRPVSVVEGSPATEALARRGIEPDILPYPSLDLAVDALLLGDAVAVVDSFGHLYSFNADRAGQTTILDDVLMESPLAIGMQRYDVSLRNVVNRTLQALDVGGTLEESYAKWFPDADYPGIEVWADSDERSLDDYEPILADPADSLISHILAGESIRVGGIGNGSGPPYRARLDAFNRALAEELSSRWGITFEFLPPEPFPTDQVASGQADMAFGVEPVWDGLDRVDYSQWYLMHGDMLMVAAGSDIEGFYDLRGRYVGLFGDDDTADDRLGEITDELDVRVRIYWLEGDEDALRALEEGDVWAVFGDSLRLLTLAEEHPDEVDVTGRYYNRVGVAIALPPQDPDFRSLVNITLQDVASDGTFARLWGEHLRMGEPFDVEIWPGTLTGIGLQLWGESSGH